MLYYKASQKKLDELTKEEKEMDELRKKEKEKQAKKELCKLATKAADPGAEPESTEGEDENFEEYTEGEDESCETAEEGNPLKLSESKKVTTAEGCTKWE